jgi:hypothetical protein
MPNDATGGAASSTPPGKVTLASAYARRQLDDALSLVGYGVSAGVQTAAGAPLSFADIGLIHETAAKLGKFDPSATVGGARPSAASQPPPAPPSVTAAEWIAFEQAYYRLAVAMSPVTAETLRATEATMPTEGEAHRWLDRLLGYSPALQFTRRFSFVAICLAAFVIISECAIYVFGQEADARKYLWQRNLLESLVPWAYGAVGSCAYLLRSGHYFIYGRSFDLRRKPEYFNRVLLGAISGGAIILFVDYLVDDGGGTVLHLSSAALGFVAGYSTDFLFNTIERVVAAIFPKTDGDPKQPPSKPAAKQPPPDPDPDNPPGDPGGKDGNKDSSKDSNEKKPRQRKPSGTSEETGSAGRGPPA